MNNYDYVILNLLPWQIPTGSNSRDIARILAKRNRVLWVDPALDWSAKLQGNYKVALQRDSLRQYGGNRLVEVEPNLWVLFPNVTLSSINWLPDNALYDWFNQRNNARLAEEIRWALNQLGMTQYALFNDNEMFRGFYLKELLDPACYVYYIRDNTMVVDYWRRHGERLEPALMQKADLVVANSPYLTAMAARSNANSVDVGQGCDLTQFVSDVHHPQPSDLAGLPHPRIGYAGALTAMRLNIPLLEQMATTRPHWQLVLLGPEDKAFQASRLHSLPNVHFLGSKPIGVLPAYLQHLDVLINPQLVNALTIGNYPRKVDEYLAMGKPVVATRTEAMSVFRKQVLLADTPAQFIEQVANALSGRGPSSREERVKFAKGHSWENSVRSLEQAIWQTLHASDAVPEKTLHDVSIG